MTYILYGGELSLYTGKARSYLRQKGLDFEERLATRDVYKNIIVPRAGAPIVPVLVNGEGDDGELVQDTTEIIDYLEARHPEPPAYPAGPRQKLVALLLEHYADEWLVIPAMHYRWSVLDQQYEFIMGEFGALSAPQESRENQILIGEKTSAPFRGSIPMLGVNDTTAPEIEAVYLEMLDQLNLHFQSMPYLLGARPCIADYGLMGPLYAHLGRDPVPKEIMQSRAPAVYAWVERMNTPGVVPGQLVADDRVPETLLPVLRRLCRDFLPDVVAVVAANNAYMAEHPAANIPRYLGMHTFQTGKARSERIIHSYSQWMFQRSWDHYHSLEGEARQAADRLLQDIGGHAAMQTIIERRVHRRPGQLELVEDVI